MVRCTRETGVSGPHVLKPWQTDLRSRPDSAPTASVGAWPTAGQIRPLGTCVEPPVVPPGGTDSWPWAAILPTDFAFLV